MANQSLVSIPPNIDDVTVLRRVLTRIVEQLDTISGSRTGSENAYVKKSDFTNSLSDVQRAVASAREAAGRTDLSLTELNSVVNNLLSSIEDITEQIEDLDARLTAVEDITEQVEDLDTRLALVEANYVKEAPEDGQIYARQNGLWVDISAWAP